MRRMPGALICSLCAVLFSTFGPQAVATAQGQTGTAAKPVRVEVTVTDARRPGLYVSGLSREQITVLDENAPSEIVSLVRSERPQSVVVLFDVSRAHHITKGRYAELLANTKKALLSFVRMSGKGGRYFVAGFDAEVHPVTDWVGTAEEVAGGFERLAALKPSKGTATYDALGAALENVGGGAADAKRVIILVTAGRDDGSNLKYEELLEKLRRSDALLYSLGAPTQDLSSPDIAHRETLRRLCAVGGGAAINPATRAEFYEAFERLSVELKFQYTLSFIPGAGGGGGWRRLSFAARPLDFKGMPAAGKVGLMPLAVRGREGYYPNPE